MKNEFNPQEPQLVLNPYSKKYIDIAPFFRVLHESFDDRLVDLIESIDDSIRLFTLYTPNENLTDPNQFKNSMYCLYELKKSIKGMQDIKAGEE